MVATRHFRVMFAATVVADVLLLVSWCLLLVGMGPQSAVSPLAGRLLIRSSQLVVLWTLGLFFLLWLKISMSGVTQERLLMVSTFFSSSCVHFFF